MTDRALYCCENLGIWALEVGDRALFNVENIGIWALEVELRGLYCYENIILLGRALYTYENIAGDHGLYAYENIIYWARVLYAYENVTDVTLGYTLADAMLDLARVLMDVHEGNVESSGDLWHFDDPRLAAEGNEAGKFLNGTVWTFVPTDETRVVANHSGERIDLDCELFYPLLSGHRYAVAPAEFPRRLLQQAVNQALKEVGPIPFYYEMVSDGSTEYAFDYPVMSVEIDGRHHYNWKQTPDLAIRFDDEYVPEAEVNLLGVEQQKVIKIVYLDQHAELLNDWDVINPLINPMYVRWCAAIHALRWYQAESLQRHGTQTLGGELRGLLANEARDRAKFMMQQYPIYRDRTVKVAKW